MHRAYSWKDSEKDLLFVSFVCGLPVENVKINFEFSRLGNALRALRKFDLIQNS